MVATLQDPLLLWPCPPFVEGLAFLKLSGYGWGMSKISAAGGFHLVLPLGFASLDEAAVWEASLARAERAIDELCGQKIVFALESLLREPLVSCIEAQPARAGVGIFLSAKVYWRKDVVGLADLRPSENDSEATLTSHGDALRRIHEEIKKMEDLLRERRGLSALFAVAQPNFQGVVLLCRGMQWQGLALALGAPRVADSIEKAQLAKATRMAPASPKDLGDDWDSER